MDIKLRKLFVMAAVALCSASLLEAAVRKGPYMVYEGDNTEMTVMWQLDSSPTCTIRWGTDQSYSTGSSTVSSVGDNLYTFNVPNLVPGTKYYYTVDNGVGEGQFWAAPPENSMNIKFLGWGDSRSNPDITARVMDDVLNEDDEYFTFALMAGDWTQKDREEDWSSQHFNRNYAENLDVHTRVPLNGCRGNHEREALVFNKYYPYNFAKEGASYYAFEYGPVKVITIDQYKNYAPGSAQYNWIESELANTLKPIKIIQAHEPAWTSGSHGNNAEFQELQDMFKEHDVAMVFCGHNHVYTRCEVDGIPHITSGGTGAGADPDTDDDGTLSDPYVEFTETCEHFVKFEVTNGVKLVATVIDERGNQIDSFSFTSSTVIGPMPPLFKSDPIVKTGAMQDSPFSASLAGDIRETNGDLVTINKLSGPAWLNVSTNGVLSGTPLAADAGANSWQIEAYDVDGAVTGTLTIVVSDGSGVANAGVDQAESTEVGTLTKITLDASASEGYIESYTWSEAGVVLGTGVVVDVMLAAGVHNITLEVVDRNGGPDMDVVVITIAEHNPLHADAGEDILVAAGPGGTATVTLDGSSSFVDNDDYLWKEKVPGVDKPIRLGSGKIITYTFDIGVHEVTLRVKDEAGNAERDTVIVTVVVDDGDIDDDNLPDDWERRYFGGLDVRAVEDADLDGQVNEEEYIAGTDPTNAASFFAINAINAAPEAVIEWQSVDGRVYKVFRAPSLTNTFEALETVDYPAGSYTDALHNAENSGFYKVEVDLK